MEIDYHHLMAQKTDAELQVYIDNGEKYTPEAIDYAITELKQRGKSFTEEEITHIRAAAAPKIKSIKTTARASGWRKNVTKDPAAPLYYSERAIYIFSCLFSTIFGAVLLSQNVKNVKPGFAPFFILSFGGIYTVIGIVIFSNSENTTGLTMAFNGLGAVVLNNFFWKKYLGDIEYRTKPIWIPLIISLIVTLPILIAAIYFR